MKSPNLPPTQQRELSELLLKHTPAELAIKVMQLTNLLKINTELLVEKGAELARRDEQIAALQAKAAIATAARN